MRFACLGSGSRGNATLVESGGTRLLVDCGFSVVELERRLAALAVDPRTLGALLVTHEHTDHVRGVAALSRKYGLPVWMTPGTCKASASTDLSALTLFNCHDGGFRIGALTVQPYAVPHDAREPSQFTFRAERRRFSMLTDVGRITPHITSHLQGSDALLLEFNHDVQMLAEGPYPPSLRRRVGGDYGHLSNTQAARLLAQLDHVRLSHLVAAHLSDKNNHPEKAREAVLQVAPGLEDRLHMASQGRAGEWLEV